jgi:CMP-N-acetylneuraminic acid synthetase
MKCIALIPARAGSTEIRNKNIIKIQYFPLIAWSIFAARLSKEIDDVYVSTDSKSYAETAKMYGAKVPFLRPRSIAGNLSKDIDYIRHFLKYLEKSNINPEYIILLRPTSPFRDPEKIDEIIKKIKKESKASSIRTIQKVPFIPEKCVHLNKNGYYSPIFKPLNLIGIPRQKCKQAYIFNGYADIFKVKNINKFSNIYGDRSLGFVTETVPEIDNKEDLVFLNKFNLKKYINLKKLIIKIIK